MPAATNPMFLKAARYVSAHLQGNDASHDWEHVRRVCQLALQIAQEEAERMGPSEAKTLINLDLIQMGALFHDIADMKYQTSESDPTPKQLIEKFMASETTYPPSFVEDVIYVVENVSFRKELQKGLSQQVQTQQPRDLALAIVQDADRLEAIGAIGIARCFAYSGAKKSDLYPYPKLDENPESFDLNLKVDHTFTAQDYHLQTVNGGSTAIGHFYEKLFKLKDCMKTTSGRKLAEERHKFMETFVDQFRKECSF